ncbi:UNVERIFIED_CONTAM: hypothetical protein FKN15_038073 [Acipenser sinensis]
MSTGYRPLEDKDQPSKTGCITQPGFELVISGSMTHPARHAAVLLPDNQLGEPNLYSPVFLAHSTRGSPTSTHLCSRLIPPEGAQTRLTCVPGSLHQREPNLNSPVFLAHSTRGSPTSTYLCSWLTPPEGAQPQLTCVPGSLHLREPNLNLPVVQNRDIPQAKPVSVWSSRSSIERGEEVR